ncbi:MAG: hypothetical protein JXA66_01540 [Oligoflexia bacterium]|nr:hypothetical protein [Oligoflexia bacterium]
MHYMRLRKFLSVFFLVSVMVSVSAHAASEKERRKRNLIRKKHFVYRDLNLVLNIKKEVIFDFPVGKIETTNKSLFKTFDILRKAEKPEIDRDKLVLTANAAGKTDMWVYDNKDVLKIIFHVTATEENLKRIFGFVSRELKHVEGLKMYVREDKIVLDGEILLPGDIARIHQVITGFDDVFRIQYKMSPVLFKIVAEKMQKEIGLPDVHVEVINERFVVKGYVESEEQKEMVFLTAMLYLPRYYYVPPDIDNPKSTGALQEPRTDFKGLPIVMSFLKVKEPEIPVEKDIKIVVHFVEIAKGFENSFGFQWGPAIDDGSQVTASYNYPESGSSGGLTAAITGTITNFIPKLNNAVEHKRGRVLQSAAVTVMNGQSGVINKTTNYPYLVQTDNGMSTQNAKVGLTLSMLPEIIGDAATSKDMQLQIQISVDQVVSMPVAGGAPVTSSDVVQTVFTIKSEETAAVGGLIQNIYSKGFGNDPGHKDPVFFNLSRSKSFTKNKSQFVLFVTPAILKSPSEGNEKVKKQFRMQ